MLVALGFLVATLLGLAILPAYRRRTERLTRDNIKRSMPLTESEIRADKDRLRADYAIVIHELEEKLDKGNLISARQKVEINRRDAAISALEGELALLRTSLEEHENARRVLEQTIMDRLPKVELRLVEARKLLTQRDREITTLSHSADKRASALEEANQINAQNRDEIHRLNAALATRAARNRDGMGDQRFDGEVALRAEIEALRSKTREQETMVARLQGLLERAGGAIGADHRKGKSSVAPLKAQGNGSEHFGDSSLRLQHADAEIAKLRNQLTEAEMALRNLQSSAEVGKAGRSEAEKKIRDLKTKNDDQAAELARLKAALKTYEDSDRNEKAIADSKMSLKAKLVSLLAQVDEQTGTIGRLRAEVAAANEKLARQASHYVNEMRRLGVGTLPAAGSSSGLNRDPQRPPEVPRETLQERINQPRARLFQTTNSPDNKTMETNGQDKDQLGEKSGEGSQLAAKKSNSLLRAVDGFVSGNGGKDDEAGSQPSDATKAQSNATKEQSDNDASKVTDQNSDDAEPRRGGLLERITKINIAK